MIANNAKDTLIIVADYSWSEINLYSNKRMSLNYALCNRETEHITFICNKLEANRQIRVVLNVE